MCVCVCVCTCVLLCVLWVRYLPVACAQIAARLWHCGFSGYGMKCSKPPGVAGRTGWSGSPAFTCSATVVSVNRERSEKLRCAYAFFLALWPDNRQHIHCLPRCSFCCRCSENWDPTTAVWEWTGNPTHSPSLSVASFSSAMIVLWCTVHISNYPEC